MPVFLLPDSKYVAACSIGRIISVWGVRAGRLKAKLEGHSDSTFTMFTPTGRYLVTGSAGEILRVKDLVTRSLLCELSSDHAEPVLSVCYLSDRRCIATRSLNRTI